MTIRTKLTLLISVLVVVTSLALGVLAVTVSMNIVRRNTTDWMVIATELGANLVASHIENRFAILQELANMEQLQTMNQNLQMLTLYHYIEELDIDDFAIITPDGMAWHLLSGETVDLSQREYVRNALRGQQTLSDLIPPNQGAVRVNYPIMNYVVPIRLEDEVVGALLARVNAYGLSNVIESVRGQGDNYAYIINTQGQIIAHTTNRDMIMRNPIEMARTDSNIDSLANAINYILARGKGYTDYTFNNEFMLAGFAPVPGYNFKLILSAVNSSLMRDVVSLRNLIIIIIIVSMAIGISVSVWIAGWISFRLGRIRDLVSLFGSGDFSQKIKIRAKDEIGAIGISLNQCSDNIQRLVQTIQERAKDLSNIGSSLSEEMVQTTSAMNQISSNVENINTRMDNQSASVTETNATMKQMISTIGKLSENVETQSASVTQSSSAIEEMLASINSVTQTLVKNVDNVKALSKASDAGRSGLQEVATDIQEIARESEGLLEINAVMESIAGQTNLLSMNAAIEAAHAGDAGKGFAVVADEIRKLAESSSEQSKIISEILKKIKESIDKIIDSTNTVLNKFEAIDKSVKTVAQQEDNIRASMEEQNTGSKQILEAIGRLNGLTQQVKNSSNEMREGSQQVMEESKNLEQVTAEIKGAMTDMGNGTLQISNAVNRVKETTAQNKENISVLVEEVKKFKTNTSN